MEAPVAPQGARRTVVTIADGVRAVRVEAVPSPLPPSLDQLLTRLAVTDRQPFVDLGTRRDCTDEQHDYRPWLAGVFAGLELRLYRCPYCTTVEVRDMTLDLLPGVRPGRGGPRRRNDVIGWYSGNRPSGREYR
jgi:hypothetical protein